MFKKIIATVALVTGLCLPAYAFHANQNPMSPRKLSVEATNRDYSFGLTVLPGNTIDSVEGFNRAGPWRMNYYVLDKYILRPVAVGYSKLPSFARTGVHNFISNVGELNNTVNNVFVGRFADSGISLSRLLINTTIGVLGLFDVAGAMGINSRQMSFDTVEGIAGVDSGSYIMVPAMGPTTHRALHGTAVDSWPMMLVPPFVSFAFTAVSAVDTRAGLLGQDEVVSNSLDPYAQTRQMYLQYREGKVNPDAAMKVSRDENVEEFMDEIDE